MVLQHIIRKSVFKVGLFDKLQCRCTVLIVDWVVSRCVSDVYKQLSGVPITTS